MLLMNLAMFAGVAIVFITSGMAKMPVRSEG